VFLTFAATLRSYRCCKENLIHGDRIVRARQHSLSIYINCLLKHTSERISFLLIRRSLMLFVIFNFYFLFYLVLLLRLTTLKLNFHIYLFHHWYVCVRACVRACVPACFLACVCVGHLLYQRSWTTSLWLPPRLSYLEVCLYYLHNNSLTTRHCRSLTYPGASSVWQLNCIRLLLILVRLGTERPLCKLLGP
jgi:hypothetical protein